ncbi:MAG: hypothetical protein ACD_30C00065G0002 [uncultured bacterium]|nr:MAG: hypothetical protein ACD_30C00065G0002 [uncultured bacterium]
MIVITKCDKLSSMLYIVATPIGNLKDVTLRALETLKEVDGIVCEDSRRTSLLLNHYEIHKPLLVLNDFNESKMFPQIIAKLQSGQNLALVSDAGTPLISDPGYKLVRECVSQNIPIDSLPGPSSVITALTLSSLPPDKFFFLGYLPEKSGRREQVYKNITEITKIIPATFIIFVAPFKLVKTLGEIKDTLGDIEISLAHELTKIHQSVDLKPISLWLEIFSKQPPKGEYSLLLNLTHSLSN